MFDGKAFGVEIVGIVKAHVERTVAPLLDKIEALEKQIASMPVSKDGSNGIDGKSVAPEDLTPIILAEVEKAVAALPVARDGVDGTNGENGTSVTLEDIAPLVADEVSKAIAEIPPAKDGINGVDGKTIDPALVQAMVAEAVAAIPPAEKGKDADPAEMARLITVEVERAVAALPVPKDGAPGANGRDGEQGAPGLNGKDGLNAVSFFKDANRHVIATMSDGTTRDLGEFDGKDGAPGIAGKDGLDGVGFDDIDLVEKDDGIFIRFTRGEVVKEWRLPVPRYRGIFKEGQTYRVGDVATWGGHTWHCDGETSDKPDGQERAWTMMVRRGRDGKDADSKPKPVKG